MSSVATSPGFFTKERTVAGPAFSRWLVPPAALAIHLCIGMACGFSVFWLPLSKAVGITTSVACPKSFGALDQITATNCDWKISMLGWTYTLFFIFLGSAAALMGGICNLLIKPVPAKYYMTVAQLDALDKTTEASRDAEANATVVGSATPTWMVYAAWVPVAIPLLWAVGVTLQKAALIFSQS